MKSLKLAVLAVAAFASGPSSAQEEPSLEQIRAALVPYASSTDSVILPDGRQLAFVCMGEGSPTVILTPGAGANSFSWAPVQAAIAKVTRVCAWDRPGWGLSDGSTAPQTVATTSADLETALAAATLRGPYVLVGHSLGSYESLLFADRHPERIVGMVLVDPSIPDQFAIMERIAPLRTAQFRQQQVALDTFHVCAAQIRSGVLQPGGPDPDNCITYPAFMPDELRTALASKVLGNPLQYESQASFLSNIPKSSRIVVNSQRNYRDMPLVVLTATLQPRPEPEASPEQLAEAAAWDAEWNRGHDALAALSTRGINARVPGASHNTQNTRPQVVIDAVEAVVAEAREVASR
jgi:pimeloyl-ACP methyl ester carboxylesterase